MAIFLLNLVHAPRVLEGNGVDLPWVQLCRLQNLWSFLEKYKGQDCPIEISDGRVIGGRGVEG